MGVNDVQGRPELTHPVTLRLINSWPHGCAAPQPHDGLRSRRQETSPQSPGSALILFAPVPCSVPGPVRGAGGRQGARLVGTQRPPSRPLTDVTIAH